jgi:hypothetical protein
MDACIAQRARSAASRMPRKSRTKRCARERFARATRVARDFRERRRACAAAEFGSARQIFPARSKKPYPLHALRAVSQRESTLAHRCDVSACATAQGTYVATFCASRARRIARLRREIRSARIGGMHLAHPTHHAVSEKIRSNEKEESG